MHYRLLLDMRMLKGCYFPWIVERLLVLMVFLWVSLSVLGMWLGKICDVVLHFFKS